MVNQTPWSDRRTFSQSCERRCCIVESLIMRQFRPAPLALLLATTFTVMAAHQAAAQQSTTATYGDWVVQCRTDDEAQRNCDMAQVTQVKGKNLPFSRVAVQHPVKGRPVRLVVQLPVNVSLPSNVRIQASDADPGLIAPFDRCVPAGCFADFDLKEEAIRKFRDADGAGRMTFKAADRRAVSVPVSFKGFGQAFDALAKE